jgi:hypothetical protein
VKRSALGAFKSIFGSYDGSTGSTYFSLIFTTSDTLRVEDISVNYRETTQVFRDASAWYHLVLSVDTTNGTANDRIRLYVNGSQVTAFNTTNNPSSSADLGINGTYQHGIGRPGAQSAYYQDGYLADIHFIDGQALDPTSFGEFSATTGVWVPKQYTGTYGTNGFKLNFSDNSTAAALGTDTSGNGNTWTANNLTVANSVVVSSPVRFTWATAGTNWALSNSDYTATYSGTSTYSTLYSIALDGSTTYRFIHKQSAGDSVGGWFFKDSTGSVSTHPDELGGNSLGQRIAENGIGTYGTFASANGTSNGQDQITGFSSITPTATGATNYSEWVINMSVRKVWVRQAGSSTWIKGGDPSNTSSTPSFSLPSGTIYFGYVGYSATGITSIDTFAPATNGKDIDSLVDVPTNGSEVDTGLGNQVRGNYCTWNPLAKTAATTTLSNGNLEATGDRNSYATFAIPPSGKWYWEITPTAGSYPMIGVAAYVSTSGASYVDTSLFYYGVTGQKYNAGSNSAYGSSYTSNDVIGVAVNADSGTVEFYKNGSSQGSITYAASGLFPATTTAGGSATYIANFGQRPFAYTAPSGFKAICTANLPAPLVTKPSTVMDVKLYSGTGSTQSITGLGFSPDFVWIKRRDGANAHALFDVIRGVTKVLESSNTGAEKTNDPPITSFDSSGFTVEGTYSQTNASSASYVAWAFDGGSSTVTNTAGSISSQVRANASAGFSIVGWNASGANGTIGHGLNAAPSLIITKNRGASSTWFSYHSSLGATKVIYLNATDAAVVSSNKWNDTEPTSSVFSVGDGGTNSYTGNDAIAYCFAPVAGYASMGSFVANANSDGPFVYTSFKPRLVLCKLSSASGADWLIFDTARSPYNVVQANLRPNTSGAEESAFARIDILSNGFKVRAGSGVEPNGTNGNTYIYAAWAESPFNYSRAA